MHRHFIRKVGICMRGFCIFWIAFMVYMLFSQAYGQAQEAKKTFPYQRWQFLYESKCSKCHTLERVFAEPKTDEEWRSCVARMIQKSPSWITKEEEEQILAEILGTKEGAVGYSPKKKKYDDARLLFIDRCTKCHSVNRVIMANKTKGEWEETVMRMHDNAPDLFLDEDLPVIIDYLAERAAIMRDDIAAKIIVDKCLICHEGGRILLERKSRSDWEKTVTDMSVLVKQGLKKNWFRPSEFKIIVDLLVKTQGFTPDGS